MFCHFAQDTFVTLHVGAERAANPLQRRLCPGWDPRTTATATAAVRRRRVRRAREPQSHRTRSEAGAGSHLLLGPPNDDFVMNVGHPAYREFMATRVGPAIVRGL